MSKEVLYKKSLRRQLGLKAPTLTVEFVAKNPDPKQVPVGKLIVVGVKNKYAKWAYLKCPSGCGETLMLSLQRGDNPRWRLRINNANLPTIYPSVWKTDGCRSHFLIRNGTIVWAEQFRKLRRISSGFEPI